MSKLRFCHLIVVEPADPHLGITQVRVIKNGSLKRKARLENPRGAKHHRVSELQHRRRRKTQQLKGLGLQ